MIISLSFYLTALLFRVLTHQKGIFLFTAISQVVKSYTQKKADKVTGTFLWKVEYLFLKENKLFARFQTPLLV